MTKTDGSMGFQKLIPPKFEQKLRCCNKDLEKLQARKSPAPVSPRALGELAGRLKNYHQATVVWLMGTVCRSEMWQLLQPYC